MRRGFSVSEKVCTAVDILLAELSASGYSKKIIEQISAEIIEVLLIKIRHGILLNPPKYLMPDPINDGYSIYAFVEGNVSGIYASSPSRVHIFSVYYARPIEEMTKSEAA